MWKCVCDGMLNENEQVLLLLESCCQFFVCMYFRDLRLCHSYASGLDGVLCARNEIIYESVLNSFNPMIMMNSFDLCDR